MGISLEGSYLKHIEKITVNEVASLGATLSCNRNIHMSHCTYLTA